MHMDVLPKRNTRQRLLHAEGRRAWLRWECISFLVLLLARIAGFGKLRNVLAKTAEAKLSATL